MKHTLSPSICLMVSAIVLAACSDDKTASRPQQAQTASTDVGVVTLASQSVPVTSELPGRVLASATAEIRPQVDGIVRKQVFREASEVKAGDVLYELDFAKFAAARDSVAATLQGAQAAAARAQAKFNRTEQLNRSRTASAQSLDDARTELLQAQANVASAEAALNMAQIELDNSVIKAPIPGRIGTSSVSVGSLVTANQTDALATIRQIDPVNVDLAESSANFLKLQAQAEAGTFGRNGRGRSTVQLVLEDGSPYSETGTISLADVIISESTGSYSLRATFANPRRILRPGMFVRATVAVGSTPNGFLVPQRAVTRNSSGKATAFFVTGDNRAEMRIVTTGRAVGNDWLVIDGVANGDRVIVDGLQKIADGAAVNPIEVEIDSDGVVEQAKPPASTSANAPEGAVP